MVKELSAAFGLGFWSSFSRIQLTNEQFVYVLLSSFLSWPMLSCGCKVPFSDHRNRTARGCVQGQDTGWSEFHTLGSWPMEISFYHDSVYKEAQKRRWKLWFSWKLWVCQTLPQKADQPPGDFEEPLTRITICQVILSFNAPSEVVPAIKDAGYDVMDLGHNHIFGFRSRRGLFGQPGALKMLATPLLMSTRMKREARPLVIKEVNGIKIAILAYAGMKRPYSKRSKQMSCLIWMKSGWSGEIQKAEQEADITIVTPQMGIEYQLSRQKSKKSLP